MSIALALSSYVNLNLLIILGFLGLGLFSSMKNVLKFTFSSRNHLRLHYAILSVVFTFGVVHLFVPTKPIFSPPAKVWSAQSIKSFGKDYSSAESGYVSLPSPDGPSIIKSSDVSVTCAILALIIFLIGGFFLARDLALMFRIKRISFLYKSYGRVKIYINDEIKVPFSYWIPGHVNIVIPSYFLGSQEKLKIAVFHELQHHRHQDTKWVYVLWGLKLVCIANPIIYFWNRWISEIQEFACDEALVDQGKVDSQAYASCLVEVAQTAFNSKSKHPACATGLSFLVERNLLKRRIKKMLSMNEKKMKKGVGLSFVIILSCIMGITAYASRSLVQDRRVNEAQAMVMAEKARQGTEFPIVVNDLVLKQLNKYIGTSEGREFIKNSLARMENHKAMISGYLQKYGVPIEILAVPIIESGYQNLSENNNPLKSAGIWQFTRATGKNYGLKIEKQKDERLNLELSTDAAMRYLQSNNLRFKDWQLSTLAYNMGEDGVQKGIDALGSRDAWELIRAGYEGDKDYLAKVMAAILIIKNPDSVE